MFHCTFHLAPTTLCLSRRSAAVMKSGGGSKVTAGSDTQNPGIVNQVKGEGWLLCFWGFQQVSPGISAEGTNGWRMDDGCSGTICLLSVMNLFRLISHTEPTWSSFACVCVCVCRGLEGGWLTLSSLTTDPKIQCARLFCFKSSPLTHSRRVWSFPARGVEPTQKKWDFCIIAFYLFILFSTFFSFVLSQSKGWIPKVPPLNMISKMPPGWNTGQIQYWSPFNCFKF